MAGLQKPTERSWQDSNMALFGSSLEREVKKESAIIEPAWAGSGQEVGIKIWRIVNFKVTNWPKDDYGRFYNGDSYIILHTYKPNPSMSQLALDVYFWIGSESTQDEYGTAAYKTVELDTYHDDKAVQHREVEGYESEKFKRLFPNGMTIMKGGADSGFRQVRAEDYKPRLLHFCGTKNNVTVREVPLSKRSLNSGDVFILDLGKILYQWNGSKSNGYERVKAAQYLSSLKSERKASKTEVLEECDEEQSHPFYAALTEEDSEECNTKTNVSNQRQIRELHCVSDASGKLTMKLVKTSNITWKDFDRNDVFIYDCGNRCFVWIGSGATEGEKKKGIVYATNYLNSTDHKLIPIIVVREGQKNADLEMALTG